MPKTITIDVNDATVEVALRREANGTIVIKCSYVVAGDGLGVSRQRRFVPADFTAGQRTTLLDAFTIVKDKARSVEGV